MSRKTVTITTILMSILVLTALFAGCSDDAVAPGGQNALDTVDGTIDPNASGFSYTLDTAFGPAGLVQGPFILRGQNIHYNDVIGALIVDFTVENAGSQSYPEPVWLEFIKLIPDTVTVINSDNDLHGPGAIATFQFENDDAMWTPGEISIPRDVMFKAELGQAIGFAARIHVGPPLPRGGTIGGVVWNDRNENGVRDNDEEGIPGIPIYLTNTTYEDAAYPEIIHRVFTGPQGSYRFTDLWAGQYDVRRGLSSKLVKSTTPELLRVILVPTMGGGVSDFLEADFGAVLSDSTRGRPLQTGDFVRFGGEFKGDAHQLVAETATIYGCSNFRETPCAEIGYEVAGAVLEIDRVHRLFRVMDVIIQVDDHTGSGEDLIDFDDLEVGERVRVPLKASPMLTVVPIAIEIHRWDSTEDVIQGYAGMIHDEDERRIVELPGLGRMTVIVTPETIIGWILF